MAPVTLLLLLILTAGLGANATTSKSGGSKGGYAPTTSAPKPATYAPSTPKTPTTATPTTSTPSTAKAPTPGSYAPTTYSPVKTTSGATAYARPVRYGGGTSLAVPLLLGTTAGLVVGSAAANTGQQYDHCGPTQVCYEGVCNQVQDSQCALDTSVVEQVDCPPGTGFTECYESDYFLCYGPAHATKEGDIKAECFISAEAPPNATVTTDAAAATTTAAPAPSGTTATPVVTSSAAPRQLAALAVVLAPVLAFVA